MRRRRLDAGGRKGKKRADQGTESPSAAPSMKRPAARSGRGNLHTPKYPKDDTQLARRDQQRIPTHPQRRAINTSANTFESKSTQANASSPHHSWTRVGRAQRKVPRPMARSKSLPLLSSLLFSSPTYSPPNLPLPLYVIPRRMRLPVLTPTPPSPSKAAQTGNGQCPTPRTASGRARSLPGAKNASRKARRRVIRVARLCRAGKRQASFL